MPYSSPPSMQIFERSEIQSNLTERVRFLRAFLNFTEEDGKVLNGAAPIVTPLIKSVVDAVYDHLFQFSYTKETFLKRNVGFVGQLADSLADLTVDDPQIQFRKKFLTIWVGKMFTADYSNFSDGAIWTYLDKVGLMHTGAAGFKHRENKQPLFVDLTACQALLAWVTDALIGIVFDLPEEVVDSKSKVALVRAFGKVMAIQGDLFSKHYVRSDEEAASHLAAEKAKLGA